MSAPSAHGHFILKTLLENGIHFRLWVFAVCHLCESTLQNKVVKGVMTHVNTVFSSSWDNGDTEKMSPWDMEPIPDDGRSLKYSHTTAPTHFNDLSLQIKT